MKHATQNVLRWQRKRRRILRFEQVEAKRCLASIGFANHIIETTEAMYASSVFPADFDGDGDLDLLAGSGGRVGWYEHANSDGKFETFHTIYGFASSTETYAEAADIDGDRDLDVVALVNGHTMWFENLDGRGHFGREQPISDRSAEAFGAIADMDGDGDLDVITISSWIPQVIWHENRDGMGSFDTVHTVAERLGTLNSIVAGDIDGDGDLDLAAGFNNRNELPKLAWIENTNGRGEFGRPNDVSRGSDVESIVLADADNDGDLDILSGENTGLVWYENTNGTGNYGEHHLISEIQARFVTVGDIDSDGDLDIVSAEADYSRYHGDFTISLYENTNGLGEFHAKQSVTHQVAGMVSATLADVDDDGDLDLFSASTSDDKFAWYENMDGMGSFGPQNALTTSVRTPMGTTLGDLDGDGDLDTVVATSATLFGGGANRLVWYENQNTGESFSTQKFITNQIHGITSVAAADVDGDGDLDLLATSWMEPSFVWFENVDGKGDFGEARSFEIEHGLGWWSMQVVDVDGDSDLDVVVGDTSSGIDWFENVDGRGQFQLRNPISSRVNARFLDAGDVDGDGDTDILVSLDGTVSLYTQTNGLESLENRQDLLSEAEGTARARLADIDGDGDLDVLSIFSADETRVAWFENENGAFGPERVMARIRGRSRDIGFGDFDGDGDVDVFSAFGDYASRVIWFENRGDNALSFARHDVIQDVDLATYIVTADIDGDGDLDVMTASYRYGDIRWYESRPIGDVNDNGRFDSSDLVRVFQAGKYEDGIDGNATFEEGDWNGDGDFDTTDLVLAFQSGSFVATTMAWKAPRD